MVIGRPNSGLLRYKHMLLDKQFLAVVFRRASFMIQCAIRMIGKGYSEIQRKRGGR
jgi:hypothetical protein